MGRLVFLDLDGTLLTHHQQVPADAEDALRAAVKNGHRLWIASGRANCEIYPWLLEYGFQGIVGANGSYAQMLTDADRLGGKTVGEAPENMIFDHRIEAAEVAFLENYLSEIGGLPWWSTPNEIFTTESFMRAFRPAKPGDPPTPWQAYVDQVTPHVRIETPPVASKLVAMLPSWTGVSLEDFRKAVGSRFCVLPSSINSKTLAVEVTLAGITKGSAVQEVASSLWFPLADTIAVGDSANDVEMLKVAGFGVAMGNGTPEAKQAADWVTLDISEGGLSQAFAHCGLI
ncbi:HAD family hydrolase [Gleimia sp. 6138-11-ORH1]|uniref:HAD family hydrolase n=1 Tax=Gleimia sp. 6138-11-ORH1 TaxID=2973937 RepID=UPI0021699EBF|nr:HAD family hydrolase [Gleimia sp. 6138-11-ORH1]MCS4483909.1 HAD family hydrolase [Gleimia sp. 6138-11-ORH1]